MADYSFIAKPAQPDGLKPISGMLDIAQKAQGLQTQNVDLQKQQIMLGERKGIQQLFSDPAKFTGADGAPDFNKLIELGMQAAPTTFPGMVPSIITAHREGVAAKAALNTFDNERRAEVGKFVMSLADDTPEVAAKKLGALVEANPQLKPFVDFAHKVYLQPNADDPVKWKEATMGIGRSVMTPSEQRAAATPQYQSTGGELKNINPMAKSPDLPMTLSPGSLENIETDAAGNKHVVSRSPQGSILSTRPMPGSTPTTGSAAPPTTTAAAPSAPGAPSAPPPSSFVSYPPGQAQDVPLITKERADLNAAAAQVPAQRFNNKQIIELASTPGWLNPTGAGAEKLAQIAGAIGVPVSSDYATNLQQLGHYIALQAQANAKAVGASTDQSREVSGLATGSVKMTPEALIAATKANDAFAAGLGAMNQGMEVAIKNAGGNLLAARDFKNEWAKAFDPDVYRFANAVAANDQAEMAKVLGEMKKGNGFMSTAASKRKATELMKKYQRLQELTTQGR